VDNGRGCITFIQSTAFRYVISVEASMCSFCPSNVLHFFPLSRFPKRLAKPPQLIADQTADQFYPVKKKIE
jgi:hypothetical protein